LNEQQYQDLQDLIRTPGWRMVAEHIEKQIAGLLIDLERKEFENLSEVALIQGKIRAFRAVLGYPGTRLESFEKKLNTLKEANK